jgi:hypothetical protein
MTVSVRWDDPEHTILLYSLGGTWTWNELYEAADKGLAMAATVTHMIYVIVDYQSRHGLPPNAFGQFNRINRLMTKQTELVIIAGGGTLLLSLFNLFLLITGNSASKFCWVSDLDEAHKICAARQVTPLS